MCVLSRSVLNSLVVLLMLAGCAVGKSVSAESKLLDAIDVYAALDGLAVLDKVLADQNAIFQHDDTQLVSDPPLQCHHALHDFGSTVRYKLDHDKSPNATLMGSLSIQRQTDVEVISQSIYSCNEAGLSKKSTTIYFRVRNLNKTVCLTTSQMEARWGEISHYLPPDGGEDSYGPVRFLSTSKGFELGFHPSIDHIGEQFCASDMGMVFSIGGRHV